MEKVMLVAGSVQSRKTLGDLLRAGGFPCFTQAGNSSEARRAALTHDFELVVINTPLTDEFGQELAIFLTTHSAAGVLLLVKAEHSDEIASRVEDYGVMVVSKPLNRLLFFQAVKLVGTARRRVLGLRSENAQLQSKLEEVRLVDRAKCALIQYLNMTEPQAHRYIEKQAMDMRISRREVAQNIINTYEC